jgi:hypothetical protein
VRRYLRHIENRYAGGELMETDQRSRVFARRLAGALVWIGAIGAVVGVAYDVNGMTQAHATIKVPVAVAQVEVGAGWGNTELSVPGVTPVDGWLAPSRVDGLRLDHVDGELTLAAWGSTRVEQALGRGDWMLVGLGMLVAAILLEPVLRSTALGRPFAAGNARRLLGVAGVVAVVGTVAPLLPAAAGALVLARTGLGDSGHLVAAGGLSPFPLLVAAVLAVIAEAFRRGEQLARDSEGLV